MPACARCDRRGRDGTADAGGLFYCSDCIDDENMSLCGDCGDMFPSSDMARSSAHGRVCRTCHNYLSDMA